MSPNVPDSCKIGLTPAVASKPYTVADPKVVERTSTPTTLPPVAAVSSIFINIPSSSSPAANVPVVYCISRAELLAKPAASRSISMP